VIVAPRILLSNQLYDEFWSTLNGKVSAQVMHVHSGEVVGFSTTKIQQIQCHDAVCKTAGVNQLIFTTYNSLNKIVDAGIDVDIMYCDEAHNAVQSNFFVPVAAMSLSAKYSYFFTATRRVSSRHDRGMNNRLVFGDIIENVPAPELINNGSFCLPL
jgi:predicted helicase